VAPGDSAQTSIDFNHIAAIIDYVDKIKSHVEHDLVGIELSADKWTPLEVPRGRRASPFGTFDEGTELLRTAVASRTTLQQGAQELLGALEYTSKALAQMMDNFHTVEELNRAEADGKARKVPTFAAPAGPPRTGN